MEQIRITIIITLVCALFCDHQRTEVKIRVKPGDNVTLFCDCAIPLGSHVYWIRNSSYGNQSSLSLGAEDLFNENFPRFNFVPNSSSNSYDLHIKNTSVDDEGIYYCAKAERKIASVHGMLEYQYGNRRTHLTVLDRVSAFTETPNPTPPHPNMMFIWMPLVILCPVCFLIFLCCLYCRKKKTDSGARTQTKTRHDEGEAEVYYASLNRTSLQQKQLRDKRLSGSDFSTYSQLRIK